MHEPGVVRVADHARDEGRSCPSQLYGHPARLDEIVAIARAPRPARRRGRRAGASAPSATAAASARSATSPRFSFQGAKLLVTGEGGMLVTERRGALRARPLRSGTRAASRGTFWIRRRAGSTRCRTSRRRSASARSSACDELIEAKRRIFGWYAEGLAGVAGHHAQPRGAVGAQHLLDDEHPRRPEAGLDRDDAARGAARRDGSTRGRCSRRSASTRSGRAARRRSRSPTRDRRARASTCRAACGCGATRSSGPAGPSGRPSARARRLAA